MQKQSPDLEKNLHEIQKMLIDVFIIYCFLKFRFDFHFLITIKKVFS